MDSPEDHELPSLSRHDVLDKSLYIRPRLKKSASLCTILSESYQDKERHWLPVEFRKLITKFMIANRYVFKAAHLHFQSSLFESLLSRLDLQPDSNNSAENILLKINVKRVEKFIEARSKDWQKKGYLHQRHLADGVLEVTFAKDMLEWINPNYEGKMTMPKELTTGPNQSGLDGLVDMANEEDGREDEVGDEEGLCFGADQFSILDLANSTSRTHNHSPRTNKDRMAAKNVNLAKEILKDTLTADGGAIELKSRRQFGYVQQLLDMAQDSLPSEEDMEMKD